MRIPLTAIALLIGALLTSCGTDRVTGQVLDVYGDPASEQLELSVDSCNQNPEVEVEESTTEVSLDVTIDEPGSSGDDCLDSVTVTLADPLGDREVVANGASMTVSPAE